jgi:chromosome segregation ATPase
MTQTFWESETAEATAQKQAEEPEPGSVALSMTDFSALEDRIVRAVELVKREREARAALEERVARTDAQLSEQASIVDQMRMEIRALRAERDQVRQRVERLITQLDALEL